MFKTTVQELLVMTGGRLLRGNAESQVIGLSTDSRSIERGQVFVALRGERFDGHAFVQEVAQKGAAALIVGTPPDRSFRRAAVIQVPDTLAALGDIAGAFRKRYPIPVVAITGTSGKTSTKEILRDLLTSELRVLATEGNFNNLIGVPKTLLSLTREHEIAVIEMGMNRLGEVRRLAEIAAPGYGLITTIGAGHTEGVGNIAGVAKAKGELLEVMGEQGCFFVNMENPHCLALADSFPGQLVSYGFDANCDVYADHLRLDPHGFAFTIHTPWEKAEFRSHFWGKHQLENVLAAVSVAQVFHIPLAACVACVQEIQMAPGRGRLIALGESILLLDESYNANPTSVRATLAWFKTVGDRFPRRLFVFGTMFELGNLAYAEHLAMIDAAKQVGVTHLYLYGEFSEAMAERATGLGFSKKSIHCFHDISQLQSALQKELIPGTALAIKASHGCGFEAVVKELS